MSQPLFAVSVVIINNFLLSSGIAGTVSFVVVDAGLYNTILHCAET